MLADVKESVAPIPVQSQEGHIDVENKDYSRAFLGSLISSAVHLTGVEENCLPI